MSNKDCCGQTKNAGLFSALTTLYCVCLFVYFPVGHPQRNSHLQKEKIPTVLKYETRTFLDNTNNKIAR